MEPFLTVGMATYKDFDGVYFTLQNLHACQRREGVTYMVIDNAPSRCIRTESVTRAVGGTYYHRPDLVGTSKPRDALFRYAKTPWVMCVDSHVILEPGALDDFVNKVKHGFHDKDLIQGPVIRDDGIVLGTHWNQPAPPGLWGEWRVDNIGTNPGHRPYEIMMQGLGLFAMRKDTWPGFNYWFRGFGGEEGYIHEKVRRRGGKAVSFPMLRWRHRFRDVHGGWEANPVPYPLDLRDHVWNLVVGHRELGIDATQQIYDHFGKNLPRDSWDLLNEQAGKYQPVGEEVLPKRQNLLAIWYSDNTAPESLMRLSLLTIKHAFDQVLRHDVNVITCAWNQIPDSPFRCTQYEGEKKRSHLTLLKQIQQAIEVQMKLKEGRYNYDGIVFMEHDVLYPANYFDRVGDAFATMPDRIVVSNLDYIGLNETGWLGVRERHEPMHQLSMRWEIAIANLKRAEKEARSQGTALVEPQGDRSNWLRIKESPGLGIMPSVHVNHNQGRFTSHGEVVFHKSSQGITLHPYWGHAKHYWPGGEIVKVAETQPDTGCGGCGQSVPQFATLQDWYGASKFNPSDFHEHMDTLKDLCDKCEDVTEIGMWGKPAIVAMAASKAKIVRSYAPAQKPSWNLVKKFRGPGFIPISSMNGFVPTDLVFLDMQHNANVIYGQLGQVKDLVRKYIVIHTTDIYGHMGDDNTPGLLWGIRKFLSENKEWTVIRNDSNNYGLMVMSKLEEDRKELPGLVRKGINFAKAMAKFTASGFPLTNEAEFNRRMEICLLCEYRAFDACAPCGCPLEKKLSLATEECGMVQLGLPPKWSPAIPVKPAH